MSPFWQIITSVVVAVFASTGFWSFVQARSTTHSNESKLLLGLAHDRIMELGKQYIERGYVTPDEFENLHDYLYLPYEKEGGNGTAKRIVDEVKKLPIHN